MTVSSGAPETQDAQIMIALNVLSGLVLILVGVCGLWGAIRYSERVLDVVCIESKHRIFFLLTQSIALLYSLHL